MKTCCHSGCHRWLPVAGAVVSLLFACPVRATSLLTSAYETQLEAWLGQGNLDFTNIYTKTAGDAASDFHAAVDGRGATFVLMSIYGNGGYSRASLLPAQVIGGYNPTSWTSANAYTVTTDDATRTAFLLNLSNGMIQRQNLTNEGASGSGQYQTYGDNEYGPLFGGGNDLAVYPNLEVGMAYNYSYGGTSFGNEIAYGGPNIGDYDYFSIDALEVYTFASAGGETVPDHTSTLGLLAVAMFGLLMIWRVSPGPRPCAIRTPGVSE